MATPGPRGIPPAHDPRRGDPLRQRPSALVVGQVLASCPFRPLRLRLLRVRLGRVRLLRRRRSRRLLRRRGDCVVGAATDCPASRSWIGRLSNASSSYPTVGLFLTNSNADTCTLYTEEHGPGGRFSLSGAKICTSPWTTQALHSEGRLMRIEGACHFIMVGWGGSRRRWCAFRQAGFGERSLLRPCGGQLEREWRGREQRKRVAGWRRTHFHGFREPSLVPRTFSRYAASSASINVRITPPRGFTKQRGCPPQKPTIQ